MRLARAIANAIVWSTLVQVLGKLVQMALAIASIKLVTHALGAEQYGIYGKVTEYSLFLSAMGGLGLFGNTVRKMAESPKDGLLLANMFLLRLGLSLLFFVGGFLVVLFLGKPWVFLLGLSFFGGSMVLEHLSSIASASLQAQYRMGHSVFAVCSGRLLELGVAWLLIHNGASLPLYFIAPLLGSLWISLLLFGFLRAKITLEWKLKPALLKELILSSLPLGLINIVNNLYYRFIPSYLAASALTEAQFGRYSLTMGATQTVALLSTFLMFSSLPALKQALEEGHNERAKNLYRILRRGLVGLGLAALFFGSLLGPTLLMLVSDSGFALGELAFALPLLLALTAVSYLYDLSLITLFALEQDTWILKRELLALGLASLCFGFSLTLPTAELQLLWILIGALVGEATSTFLGMQKIRKML